jgi:hypothetical protein
MSSAKRSVPMTWTKAILLSGISVFLSPMPAHTQVVVSHGPGIPWPQPTLNAPYSIFEETEKSQTLSDGTHIVTKTPTRMYRDSSGRTRTESFATISGMPSTEPTEIQIVDPVANTIWILRVQQRAAFRIPRPPYIGYQPDPNIVQKPIKQPIPQPAEMRPKYTSENLGTQFIEGVQVEGVRVTTIIPEGLQGNDKPIQIVQETWSSAEFNMAFLDRQSDLRSGETVTRVTSVSRSEPDPALFQLPPDYTVKNPNVN